MSIAGINIAPSVLGAAAINIIGNLDGLRSAMGEARTQMYGLITVANAIGGKITGALFSPIAIHLGMTNVAKAMALGRVAVAEEMMKWQAAMPVNGAIPLGLAALHPALHTAYTALPPSMQNQANMMKIWQQFKPDTKAIMAHNVEGAALGAGKWLLFGSIIAGITAAFAKAIPYASEFTEQLNKVVHTFGVSSDIIVRGAAKSTSMGLSSTEYLRGASNIGIELMGSGLSEKESTAIATQLAERASDMASFYDRDVDQILQKIMSGLAGMSRPLKELGINTQEGRVKLKALSMGFKEVNGDLTEDAKVRARAALIMQMSNRSAGDFARTSLEYKNQLRILGAQWEEIMIQLGGIGKTIAGLLLPIINAFAFAIKGLATALNSAFNLLFDLPPELISWITGNGSYWQNKQAIMDEDKWGVSVDNYYEQKRLQELQNQSEELKRGSKHTDLLGYSKTLQDSVFKKDKQAEIAKDTSAIRKLMEQRNQMRNPGSDKAADFRLDLFMGNALIS